MIVHTAKGDLYIFFLMKKRQSPLISPGPFSEQTLSANGPVWTDPVPLPPGLGWALQADQTTHIHPQLHFLIQGYILDICQVNIY